MNLFFFWDVVAAILPVVKKQHQLLVTLLLCNAAAMEVKKIDFSFTLDKLPTLCTLESVEYLTWESMKLVLDAFVLFLFSGTSYMFG